MSENLFNNIIKTIKDSNETIENKCNVVHRCCEGQPSVIVECSFITDACHDQEPGSRESRENNLYNALYHNKNKLGQTIPEFLRNNLSK